MSTKRKKQKRRPLTEQQKKAADLYFEHPRYSELAALVGVDRCTIWRWMKREDFQRELERAIARNEKKFHADMMKRYRASEAAYHRSPEYQRERRKVYEARRKMKKVSEQLNNASSYKEFQRLHKEYERLYNIANFGGQTAAEYMSRFDHLFRK